MARLRRQNGRAVDLSIAPLIDLVFILLIFFLVGARFTKETGVEIERPSAVTASAAPDSPVVVAITPAGTVHMEGRRVALAILRERVQAALGQGTSDTVVVLADTNVPTGRLITVMDVCREGGAKQVLVATDREGVDR